MNGNANSSSSVVVSANNNANAVAVSANKRKIGSSGRQNANRGPRTKGTMERSVAAEGIYSNTRFMNAAASIVGCVIRVYTVEGSVYEGIFRTFSPQFEFVLEMGHKVDTSIQQKPGQISLATSDEIVPTLIFRKCDVEMFTCVNTDLDYATKDMFATDAVISKFNGQVAEKDLEPWIDIAGEADSIGHGLDMENANGWDVNDMFRTNEQQYGVQSSYDNSLSGYTTQLEKKNTDEYKKQEAKALKLASEIESSSIHRARIALENVDEDEKISAVVRPGDKYVPPSKRKNQQTGKLSRGGGSNASQGGYNLSSGGRLGPSGMPPHLSHSQLHSSGGGGLGSNYTRLPHSNNSMNASGPPQHHSVNSQSSSVSHYQHVHRQQTSPPSLNSNLTTSVTTSTTGTGVGGDMRKSSPHHHQHPQQQNVIIPEGETRIKCEPRVDKLEIENNKSKPQPHGTVIENVCREVINVNEARNENNNELNSASNSVTVQHQSANTIPMQLGPNHIPPKLSRKPTSKANRDEETAELKKFQTNFKLPPSEDKEDTNNVSSSIIEENEIKEKLDSDLDKTTNGVKKFTLNPNAKEFVLNPNAKAFTPRTPSTQTPTPPRAHTPGAMMTQPTISLVPGQIITTMPPYMMSSSQLATVSLTSPMGQAAATLAMHQGGPRFRKNDNDHYAPINADGRRFLVTEAPMFPFPAPTSVQPRPDFSHVAAATGQPILAPTSLTSQASFVQYQPQQMVGAHGVPQHNMPYTTQMYSVIGPRLMTAQGMSMVPTSHLVQHTDPQHVPSQMFLSTHPGVPPQLTPGPTPPHANHTPIPNINQGGPHSSQGQPPQQSQVTSMHPNPSPVHGGNTPNQQNPTNQPQSTQNAQQLSAYSNQHPPTMTQAQLQGGPHTPNSPQSMHPGQVNNSNPTHYLQAASLVAHAAASNASPHGNQAHPHPSQGGFPGTQMVLINPQGPGTPTSLTGHPTMSTHTLQGHAIGHQGVTQLVPHTSMVIPATSAGQLQAGAHQIFMPHHGGRPNAIPGRVVQVSVPTQPYQL